MLKRYIRFPEFIEFNESSISFGKNSINTDILSRFVDDIKQGLTYPRETQYRFFY